MATIRSMVPVAATDRFHLLTSVRLPMSQYEFLSYFDSVEDKNHWLSSKREEFAELQELAFHRKGRQSHFLPLENEHLPPSKYASDSSNASKQIRIMKKPSNSHWTGCGPKSMAPPVAACNLAVQVPISPPRPCRSALPSAIATPVASPSSASDFDADCMRIDDPEADLLLDSLLAGDNDGYHRSLFENDNLASSGDSCSEDSELPDGTEEGNDKFAEV